MPVFAASAPAFQGPTSVGSSATQVFNTTGTPIGSPSVDFPSGVQLSGLSVTNVGTVTCWIGTSSVTASTGTVLKAGEQLVIMNGNNHVAAESGASSWNLYAITSSGSTTVEAALVTLPSVV